MERFLHGLLIDLEQRCDILRDRLTSLDSHPDVRGHILTAYREVEEVRREIVQILADPSTGMPQLIFNHLNKYKRLNERIAVVEAFPLPFIERYANQDRRVTVLGRTLANQVGWSPHGQPLDPLLVGAFSTEYYWTKPEFSLISVPATTADSLLPLPDLCHEMGHILLMAHGSILLGNFSDELAGYIEGELRRVHVDQRPPLYRILYGQLFVQWRDQWIWEFLADMIATYVLGPSFGYQHVRLCAGRGQAAFYPSLGQESEHPADEARLRGILAVLEMMGGVEPAKRIRSLWDRYLTASQETKPTDYDICYPQQLVLTLANRTVEGCRTLDLCAYHESTDSFNVRSLPALLNEAWERFLNDPANYRDWETARLKELWLELGLD